jgi:hypothetical protein
MEDLLIASACFAQVLQKFLSTSNSFFYIAQRRHQPCSIRAHLSLLRVTLQTNQIMPGKLMQRLDAAGLVGLLVA